MGADDCRDWEYKHHSEFKTVVKTSEEFAAKILAMPTSQNGILSDTRGYHRALFKKVVPNECTYLAGNYRGSEFECLRLRNVGMGSREGAPFGEVHAAMDQFHADVAELKRQLDGRVNDFAQIELAISLAKVVAQVISYFLRIHPYANGNGHVARLLAWVLMANYNLLPEKWWVHNKPTEWDELVAKHQDGITKPLEIFILRTLSLQR